MNKVRFAPSPTGYLHLGNARMAVLNNFLIKKIGGDFVLRIDDTDVKRVKPEYVEGVYEDLKWLGIAWDSKFKQSERLELYQDLFKKLQNEGKVYACYETKEELEFKKKIQLAKGKPPIYDRAMIELPERQRKKYEDEGRKPHYRLKIEHTEITWHDLIKGDISFSGHNISDPVIIREDGSFLYLLTSVLDDIDMEITHILRGEDHIVNTAVQIQMFQYLNAKVPQFAHLPLITNKEGAGYSKREGSLSLRNLRAQGITPLALNNYLFALGIGEQNIFYEDINAIVAAFDLAKYNSSSAKFDEEKLLKLNLIVLQQLPFVEIKAMAQEYLQLNLEESFWQGIKANINNFLEIPKWYEVCYSDNLVTDAIIDKSLLDIVIKTMPTGEFSESTWASWLSEIKAESKLSGKNLFEPIRLLFSNQLKGPEFKNLIVLIGRDRLLARLKNFKAQS